jgi:uncharacterized Zn finger protein (UPF0148 family)
MKLLVCEKCGGSDFFEQTGYKICSYCRSKYAVQSEDMISQDSIIALNDDVERLLQRCRDDPSNAHRYASLILDIDHSNVMAKSILVK